MKICFMFFLLYIISKIKTYKYFQANVLKSGNILLITDESISIQNKDTNVKNSIYSINIDNEEQILNVISFAHISSNDKEYIFCRYKQYIYVLFDELSQLCTIQNENIANYYCK